jgi:hypothetical protein
MDLFGFVTGLVRYYISKDGMFRILVTGKNTHGLHPLFFSCTGNASVPVVDNMNSFCGRIVILVVSDEIHELVLEELQGETFLIFGNENHQSQLDDIIRQILG